ncbi:P-selectin glycoprotein ligand 1 [Brienomyrus brachyistius]|uniref:P-selectin glycoprotein ligand 1 n=1 Tax=Brienomyrus brachyistius TaxID=42636 RepID=UPI0020B3AC8A|nr:P-selectin glycoprotein ligand 1 [Brienomyrus brachyistius]
MRIPALAPWAFSIMLWAAVMFLQALLVEANGTRSPDTQTPTTLSGMQEASSLGALAAGGSMLHETKASTLPLIGGTQEPIKIEVTDQGGTTSQPASNFQSTTNHELFLAMTSKPALASGSSVNNTSTHAPSNLTSSHSTSGPTFTTPTSSTHSISNSTSGLPGYTPTLLNLIHSISSSTSASPHSSPPLSDLTHSASQSSTWLPDSTSVTSSPTDAALYKRKGSSDSTQTAVISTSRPTDSTNSVMGAVVPKKLLTTTSAKTKTPTIHHEGNNASGGSNSCLSRKDGLVSQCLIAIASLAAVATFFMVCTIFLCTKLSAQKHRYRMSMNQGTEMMCISSLLPDGDVAHAKLRYPKSNGALIPSADESEGDDLTLHSFLPENERTA